MEVRGALVAGRRPAPSRLPLATAWAAALLVLGCSSTREQWAEVRFHGISFRNLHLALVDLLDVEGYQVARRDPSLGDIESEWLYGTSVREVRGPSRRKAFVTIGAEDERWVVRVRVSEEVMRKGGLLATNVALRHSDDWEPWDDNYEDAEYLAAKMRALLSEQAIKPETLVVPEGEGAPR